MIEKRNIHWNSFSADFLFLKTNIRMINIKKMPPRVIDMDLLYKIAEP